VLAQRAFLSGIDAFLAIGRANRAFYLERGVSGDRIFSTPYFVDNERFRRQAAAVRHERLALRAAWGIDASRTCVLFAGKIEPKKRLFDLLQAVERAAGMRDDISLLVVGTGEQMEEARRVVADRRLPVTFAGFLNQTEITRAYVAADCLVLPSDYGETWGLVVNEAMNCECPAIVSDRVGCANDLVLHGETGYVFPFGDVAALADVLAELSASPARRAALGAAALRHVERYSVESAVQGTIAAADFAAHPPRRAVDAATRLTRSS
jgi:glycosyltransferase involved in cell wall biosynthesis